MTGRRNSIRILFRAGASASALFVLLLFWLALGSSRPAAAQTSGTAPTPESSQPPAANSSQRPIFEGAGTPGQRTSWQSLKASGFIGLLIVLSSVVSMGFIIDHFITIRRERIMPPQAADELERKIAAGEIEEAIRYCADQRQPSLLTEAALAGLQRFQTSEFGFAEYRSAVEEEGEEQTAKLYRRTEVLSVIGAIAPMLGLLGTVQGMIQAFDTIAATNAMAKPADLADAISLALVTTLLGLMVAIPTLTFLSFFRARIDSLVAEAGKRVEHILAPLGRQNRP